MISKIERLKGRLMVAPVTPFGSGGGLETKLVAKQADILHQRGADGFYVCGRSGEGISMAPAERMRLVECWRQEAGGSVLMVNVDHACLEEARKLAAHAEKTGADAVSSGGGSVGYPAKSLPDLVEWCAEIAGAAQNLPYFFYYYNGSAPGLGNPNPLHLCRAMEERIPNFGGLKYSHEALMGMMDCLDWADGRKEILFGRDEMMLGAMAMGAVGFIGGTFNLLSPLARMIMDAWKAGQWETARQVQSRMNRCISVFGRYGGLVAVKAAMPLVGLDCGSPRLPLRRLSAEQENEVRAKLLMLEPELW